MQNQMQHLKVFIDHKIERNLCTRGGITTNLLKQRVRLYITIKVIPSGTDSAEWTNPLGLPPTIGLPVSGNKASSNRRVSDKKTIPKYKTTTTKRERKNEREKEMGLSRLIQRNTYLRKMFFFLLFFSITVVIQYYISLGYTTL